MGGLPLYAFISMSLRRDTTVEFMDDFYKGLMASGSRHAVTLLGGDTTHGTEYVFNLTLLGSAPPGLVRLRSMAVKGDLICVTGDLGGSTAGLKLLLQGRKGYLKDHLEPTCRTSAEGRAIARHAHAMIDVSDGLGSEVTHICNRSGTGARIDYAAIPLSQTTIEAARATGLDPYDFALYGGEDFELVFTIPESGLESLKGEFIDYTIVGEILDKEEGIRLFKDGQNQPLEKGYDHFA
jgi:thiamine-monophosphate kinase